MSSFSSAIDGASQKAIGLSPAVQEVIHERQRQDAKWGGPEHDDTHTPADWVSLMDDRLAYPEQAEGCDEYRKDMVEIAALAIAAIESFDRRDKEV